MNKNNNRVLVTGGAGFIGSNLVDRLIAEGYDIAVVDNLSTGKVENINPKARFYKLDIQSPELEDVFKKEKPDYVSHHAAQIDVRKSVSDPIFDAQANVLGTINVFQSSVNYKVKKVVYISSGGAIYGEQEVFPATEEHPARPISPYGITKLTGEHYLHYFKEVFGLEYVVLRYANVYGPRQDPYGEAGVVAIFTQKMIKGEQPTINGDGENKRDYVYVGDVIEANIAAIKSNASGAFNIGTGIETSVNQLFEGLKEITGARIKEKHGPAKPGEQIRSVLDYTKAKRILNWTPKVGLKEGLTKTWEWFKTG